jgi:hypothetical protein
LAALADSQQGLNLGLAISKAWIVGPGPSPQPMITDVLCSAHIQLAYL